MLPKTRDKIQNLLTEQILGVLLQLIDYQLKITSKYRWILTQIECGKFVDIVFWITLFSTCTKMRRANIKNIGGPVKKFLEITFRIY